MAPVFSIPELLRHKARAQSGAAVVIAALAFGAPQPTLGGDGDAALASDDASEVPLHNETLGVADRSRRDGRHSGID